MKKYFITGLVVLLPLAITAAIFAFCLHLVAYPFSSLLTRLLAVAASIPLLILLGILADKFFFPPLLLFGEDCLTHIPFINIVYKACKEMVKTFFSANSTAFRRVVLVPFPEPHILSIGFITRDELKNLADSPHISVFMPSTPNPTVGFLMNFPKEQVTFINMPVDAALKAIISCGILFTSISKNQSSG